MQKNTSQIKQTANSYSGNFQPIAIAKVDIQYQIESDINEQEQAALDSLIEKIQGVAGAFFLVIFRV